MPRYIDADELYERVKENVGAYYSSQVDVKDNCLDEIESMPTADVVPKSEVVNEITSHLAGLYDFFKQNDDIREAYAILFAIAELKKKYIGENENENKR